METKTHVGIHFEKGKMYGRNKISYCWKTKKENQRGE